MNANVLKCAAGCCKECSDLGRNAAISSHDKDETLQGCACSACSEICDDMSKIATIKANEVSAKEIKARTYMARGRKNRRSTKRKRTKRKRTKRFKKRRKRTRKTRR